MSPVSTATWLKPFVSMGRAYVWYPGPRRSQPPGQCRPGQRPPGRSQRMTMDYENPGPVGLYDPAFEHDACGVSFVVDMKGRKSHDIVATAIGALCHLEHRGATGDEANTGDGAGILIQVPDRFYRAVFRADLPPAGSYATGIAFLPQAATAAAAAEKA